jgi:uncharacterized membrane protein
LAPVSILTPADFLHHIVLANLIPMGIWAMLILGLTALGLGTLMLGLIVVIPVLGYASWYA